MHTAEGSVQLPTQKWQKTSFVCLKTGQNEERQQKTMKSKETQQKTANTWAKNNEMCSRTSEAKCTGMHTWRNTEAYTE